MKYFYDFLNLLRSLRLLWYAIYISYIYLMSKLLVHFIQCYSSTFIWICYLCDAFHLIQVLNVCCKLFPLLCDVSEKKRYIRHILLSNSLYIHTIPYYCDFMMDDIKKNNFNRLRLPTIESTLIDHSKKDARTYDLPFRKLKIVT